MDVCVCWLVLYLARESQSSLPHASQSAADAADPTPCPPYSLLGDRSPTSAAASRLRQIYCLLSVVNTEMRPLYSAVCAKIDRICFFLTTWKIEEFKWRKYVKQSKLLLLALQSTYSGLIFGRGTAVKTTVKVLLRKPVTQLCTDLAAYTII